MALAVPVVGDVEEGFGVVEQFLLALMHGQDFPDNHHTIIAITGRPGDKKIRPHVPRPIGCL